MSSMRAVVISRPGGPEVLEVREVVRPDPSAEEVLVRIYAAGLNRADLLQREGKYPAPAGSPADIPGLEFAGEIVGLGARVSAWSVGQRVFGLLGGGAYAEFCSAHGRAITEIPDRLAYTEAAAIPEAFITAHDALISQANLRSGERVLIHAAASGVGLAAAQIARAVGAFAYGTTRSEAKCEQARTHGCNEVAVLSSSDQLAGKTKSWLGNGGFDVVLDLVGGPYLASSVAVAAARARIMMVGSMGGRKVELDSAAVMSKRLQLIGTMLRSRPLEEKIAATQRFAREVVPLFATGALQPVLDRVFPFSAAPEAHRRLESNETVGKVVLQID
ncbi:MAG TPA: NAD(P)H-quinone oxidoreductase [Terriglobales bacterium]